MGVIVAIAALLVGASIGWVAASIMLALRRPDQYDIWDEETW